MTEPVREIRVWINAFIPRDVPGHTVPWPGRGGDTLIQSPAGLYGTDQRSFSSDINASARAQVGVVIRQADTDRPVIEFVNPPSSPTFNVDGDTGEILGEAVANVEAPHSTSMASDSGFLPPIGGTVAGGPVAGVEPVHGGHDPEDRTLTLPVNLARGNPLVPGVPTMDVTGHLIVNLTRGTITFQGAVDDFPAYEAYYSVDGAPPQALFQIQPDQPGGLLDAMSDTGLFGGATRSVSTTLSLADGEPAGVDAAVSGPDSADGPPMDPGGEPSAAPIPASGIPGQPPDGPPMDPGGEPSAAPIPASGIPGQPPDGASDGSPEMGA